MTLTNDELLELPNTTKCKDCLFRISRSFVPIDKDLSELDEIFIEHVCILLEDDISDKIILDCSGYRNEAEEKSNMLFTDFFTRKGQ